jgi:fructose-bisphosphate aldolase class II
MIARTQDLLLEAMRADPPYGVVAFNVIGLEHAEAIVAGAEAERAPVILQISQNAVRYRNGAIEPIAAACRELARAASVPVALHLDHATTHELCVRAAEAGISSIMFDASTDEHARNIALTATETEWAHANGLSIEGELGVVGGKEGVVSAAETMTDPEEAVRYVAATGIDALAIAVGTEHGMTERRASLDLARIAAIRARVDVPLVLHGSSGVPAEVLAEAVRCGITKVNMATQLNAAFTGAVRAYLRAHPEDTDPRRYGEPGRSAIEGVVRETLRLVGAAGKAPSPRITSLTRGQA